MLSNDGQKKMGVLYEFGVEGCVIVFLYFGFVCSYIF